MSNTIEHMPEDITNPAEVEVWKEIEPLAIGLPIKREADLVKLIQLLAEMLEANKLSQQPNITPMRRFELGSKAFNLSTEAQLLATSIGINFKKGKPKK